MTPSYNQAKHIEKTMRSVLLQHYPNLEYIVLDGGSTDGSVDVIAHYADHLTYWDSTPDRGQADAINRGLRIATGEIVCWLNSDDFYFPGALDKVGQALDRTTGAVAIVGDCLRVHEDGTSPILLRGAFESRRRLLEFWNGYTMHQPAIFWRSEVLRETGFLRDDLEYTFDFDYWVRLAERHSFRKVDATLAGTLFHSAAKTGDGYRRYHAELRRNATSYWGSPIQFEYWRLAASMFNGLVVREVRNRVRLRTRFRGLRSSR